MQRRPQDRWWQNRDTTWWQSLIIGLLLGPVVVLLFYRAYGSPVATPKLHEATSEFPLSRAHQSK